jgi:flagellar basal body-associated protein FliL
MQQQTSSKTPLIIIILLVIVAIGAYFYFIGTPNTNTTSSISQVTPLESANAEEVGSRVLFLLNQINSLKIDTSIFSSTVYRSLVDYTISIPEQNVGRPNPFAPIGR